MFFFVVLSKLVANRPLKVNKTYEQRIGITMSMEYPGISFS
jgi:hypothetical protein